MKNLGKFTEENFQALKGQVQGGVKSLGKMSEQAFQGLKNTVGQMPISKALQGDIRGAGQQIAQNFKNIGKDPIGDALNVFTGGGVGVIKSVGTKVGQEALKDSVYNGLKKLEFPATLKNAIEHFETQSNIIGKIEKGTATADDLRAGSELIKLMGSGKPKLSLDPTKYLYHGTNETVLDNISKEGLKPMGRGAISLSKDEAYAKSFSRDGMTPQGKTNAVMLRVKEDLLNGKTVSSNRPKPATDQLHEILTNKVIPPESLEIYKNGKWQPLVEQANPLATEATNFKTAEEFVKSQIKTTDGIKHLDPNEYVSVTSFIRDIERLNYGHEQPLAEIKLAQKLWGKRPENIPQNISVKDIIQLEEQLVKKPTSYREITDPITVEYIDKKPHLVDGRHRLDQAKFNKQENITAKVTGRSKIDQLTDLWNKAKGEALAEQIKTMQVMPLDKAIKKFNETGSVTIAQRNDGMRLVIKDEGDFVKVSIGTSKLVDTETAKNFPRKVFRTPNEAFDFVKSLSDKPKLK